MNITMENIVTRIVKPQVKLTKEGQKINSNVVHQKGSKLSAENEEGQIPIGLGVVPIIPTGSIFIPRELVVPKEEKPLEMEIIISDKQALIPQKMDENTTKIQKPDIGQNTEIVPTALGKENPTIDILA